MKKHCPKCDSDKLVKTEIHPFPDGRVELQCTHCKQKFFDNKITDKEALALIRNGKDKDSKLLGFWVLYNRYAPWLQKLIQSPRILCRKINNVNMPLYFSQEVAENICDKVFKEFYEKIANFQEYFENWKPFKEDSINPIQSKLWFIASYRSVDFVGSKSYETEKNTVSLNQLLDDQDDNYSEQYIKSEQNIETEVFLIKCTEKMLGLIKAQYPDFYEAFKANINNCGELSQISDKCRDLFSEAHRIDQNKRQCKCYIALFLKEYYDLKADKIANLIGKTPDATRAFLARCKDVVRSHQNLY